MKMTVTPPFHAETIVNEVIQREWTFAQTGFLAIGKRLHSFMRRYINNNRHRPGTGKLARSINFKILATGPGRIEWGIGDLNQIMPYYYVINYGKTTTGQRFRPGGGKYRPVNFTDGDADPKMRGQGTAKATGFKPIGGGRLPSFVRPIPFISVTRAHLSWELEKLLTRLSSQ